MHRRRPEQSGPRVSLTDYAPLTPPNAGPLERGVDRALSRIDGVDLTPIRTVDDPQACPAPLLPWLAYDSSVDDWDPDWPTRAKRLAISQSLIQHREKGTLAAIERAVLPLGGQVVVRPWFEQTPEGEPGTFQVILTLPTGGADAPPAEAVDMAIAAIDRSKSARDHYTFALGSSARGALGLVGAVRAGAYARLSLTAASLEA